MQMDGSGIRNYQEVKDYASIAKQYAKDALKDKKRKKHGVLIQQAAQRFLDDLKRAQTKDCSVHLRPLARQRCMRLHREVAARRGDVGHTDHSFSTHLRYSL